MKTYRLLLKGQNFWLNVDGNPQRLGFFTTRFIETQSKEEAEHLGVQMIRDETDLFSGLLNDASDPPVIYVEEIEEIDLLDGIVNPDLGYTFYPEENNA